MIIDELDLALSNRLLHIQVTNEVGVLTDMPVVVKAPEKEFIPEVIPTVLVSLIDIRYDPVRQDWGSEVGYTRINGRDVATVQNAPTPYEIVYQVGVFTLFQEDDRKAGQTMLKRLPPRTYISTATDSYYAFLTSFAENDIIGDRRIFRKFYTYSIFAELEPSEAIVVKLVKERLLTLKQL